jgi:folylpolyglutamate synthase
LIYFLKNVPHNFSSFSLSLSLSLWRRERAMTMTSRLRRLASGRFVPSIETQQRRKDFVCRSCSCVVEEKKKKNYKFFSSNHLLLRGEEHHRLDQLLNRFINHEQKGVPSKAGTDEDANDVFDMKRMRVFLKLLGDPHKGKTYKTIHVGGTKGKGTQIALLSSCLTKAGYTIGTYKSPHVHTFAERIRVNGRYNDKELSELFEQIWKKRTDLETNDDVQKEEDDALKQLTHFEVLTALALKYFEQKNVDIALVEVGLGGVRDATNVFDENSLECAILTHIGEEHLEALGGSIESIVRAKTGICKPSRPTFIGHQNDRKVNQLIREGVHNQGGGVIVENNAKVRLVDINDDGGTLKQRVSVVASVPKGEKEEEFQSRSVINLPLLGPHQRENAELALSVLSHMMTTTKTTSGKTWDKLTWESIREGFEACSSVSSPGNFEILRRPRRKSSETGTSQDDNHNHKNDDDYVTIVADGAHTEESAVCLRKTLLEVFPNEPIVFVLAMASDKNHSGISKALAATPSMVEMIATKVDVAGKDLRSTAPEVIAQSEHFKGVVVQDFSSAMKYAKDVLTRKNNGRGVVCVSGSLHSVTRAKREAHL